MSSKYDWWKCARCGGRFLIDEPMHGCYQGKTVNADNYGDALDATLRRIEELEREKRWLYGRFVGLLEKLHDEEVLSEQQCAKFLGVDLLAWRFSINLSGDISESQMQEQEQPD